MRAPSIRMWTAVTLLLAAGPAVADIVTLEPSQDNTLCQDPGGALSNGAGEFFFAGRTLQGTNSIRRGLLAFDVAGAIPGPALIQSAQLNLVMTMSIAGPVPVELRRVTNLWGEGPSNAPGQEGAKYPGSGLTRSSGTKSRWSEMRSPNQSVPPCIDRRLMRTRTIGSSSERRH